MALNEQYNPQKELAIQDNNTTANTQAETKKKKTPNKEQLLQRTLQNQKMRFEKREQTKLELIAFLNKYLPPDHLQRSLTSLATSPSCSSLRVNTLKIERPALIEKLTQICAEKKLNLNISSHPQMDDAILVHSSCFSQTAPMPSHKQVFVTRKAGKAILRGAEVFTPGVVAVEKGVLKDSPVSVFIDADEYFSKGTVIPAAEELEQHLKDNPHSRKVLPETHRKIFIGNGISQVSRKNFATQTQIGVKMTERIASANQLFSLEEHDLLPLVFLQNIPSMVVTHELDPQPGEKILDMCAAPGGKTTHVAARMKDRGEVYCFDRKKSGVEKIEKLCSRLGITCVKALCADSTTLIPDLEEKGEKKAKLEIEPKDIHESTNQTRNYNNNNEHQNNEVKNHQNNEVKNQKNNEVKNHQNNHNQVKNENEKKKILPKPPIQFEPNSFDRILLDPPCSGLGQRPTLDLSEFSVPQIMGCAPYQRKLLYVAWQLLRPGGTLVFSTCTINPFENEANVAWAVKNLPHCEILPPRCRLGNTGLKNVDLGLQDNDAENVQRFYPVGDFIGFFVARLRKKNQD